MRRLWEIPALQSPIIDQQPRPDKHVREWKMHNYLQQVFPSLSYLRKLKRITLKTYLDSGGGDRYKDAIACSFKHVSKPCLLYHNIDMPSSYSTSGSFLVGFEGARWSLLIDNPQPEHSHYRAGQGCITQQHECKFKCRPSRSHCSASSGSEYSVVESDAL